jgi:hypothetical protein
MFIGNFQGTY